MINLAINCKKRSNENVWDSGTPWLHSPNPTVCSGHCIWTGASDPSHPSDDFGISFEETENDPIIMQILSEISNGFEVHYFLPLDILIISVNSEVKMLIHMDGNFSDLGKKSLNFDCPVFIPKFHLAGATSSGSD